MPLHDAMCKTRNKEQELDIGGAVSYEEGQYPLFPFEEKAAVKFSPLDSLSHKSLSLRFWHEKRGYVCRDVI